MAAGIAIRPAEPGDVATIHQLILELASYEKLLHEVVADKAHLREALFGAPPAAEARVAELDGAVVAFALFFHTYSTFEGRRGLYLEDLYVKVGHRSCGIGKALLKHLARLALERDCARFEWAALDWNEPAIRVYRGIGATPMDGWTTFRLDGEALREFAETKTPE